MMPRPPPDSETLANGTAWPRNILATPIDYRSGMASPTAVHYFEDFHVGQKFVTAPHPIDAEQIVNFASQFDPQPFHLDDAAGKNTLFGGLVASGWHTASIAMRLTLEGELRIAGGMIGGGGELQWTKPVRPGDTLRVHAVVLEVTPSRTHPDRGSIVVRSETRDQIGEVVQVFTARMIVPRRTPAT